MTYTAKITLKFDSYWEPTRGIYDEEMIPEQHITVEAPVEDLNFIQLFRIWESFMQCMGHNELGIMKGACHVAFNDMRSDENMRKVAQEYDLTINEDLPSIIEDRLKQEKEWSEKNKPKPNHWEERYWALYRRFKGFAQYTDEELDAMYDHAEKQEKCKNWNGLIPGSDQARAAGCTCPVYDNDEMPDDKKWVNIDCPIHGTEK